MVVHIFYQCTEVRFASFLSGGFTTSDAGIGGPLAPQYLADQLTLFQPGRADYPHLLLLAPQCFSPSGTTAKVLTIILNSLSTFQNIVVSTKYHRNYIFISGQAVVKFS